MSVTKITEELDFLQKKVAALREIYKLYPDTLIRSPLTFGNDSTYISPSINKDVDLVRFSHEKSWFYAWTSKHIGCINVYSAPERFALFIYYPDDMFKQLIIQNYHDSMKKQRIPESIIRDCDLRVIDFIKEKKINLSSTNLKDIKPDTTIGKLLALI